MDGICTKLGQGCGGQYTARGLCHRHYRAALRSGEIQSQRGTPTERFWAKGDKHGPISTYRPDLGPCWLWTGSLDGGGYGRFDRQQAHRFAYEEQVGPIAEGLQGDHLCRVRRCVRPSHLQPVTHAENLRRGAGGPLSDLRPPAPLPTHCNWGHELTPENTGYRKDTGRPVCRRCSSDRSLKSQRRKAGTPDGRIGSANAAAVLTEADVRYIRESNLSAGALAERYGVQRTTISAVRRRITWKQVA